MKTKFYALLLFLISVSINISAYDFEALNKDGVTIYYNFSEDRNSVIVTYKHPPLPVPTDMYGTEGNEEWYSGHVVIPESIEYNNRILYITAIGDSAFFHRENLTGVSIPNNVTIIGNYAFTECYNLESVVISESVVTIGDNAFSTCISLPDNVTHVGAGAFGACIKMSKITLGKNIATIGVGAFSGCDGITDITITDKVASIGNYAFSFCLNLKEFTVSEQNMYYSAESGVLFNKDKTTLIAYPNKKSSIYTIPNSVSTIGLGAFRLCKDLTEIVIPNSVEIIEESAFYGTQLSNIIIPKNATTVGDYAFCVCRQLKKVTIGSGNVVFGDNVFYNDGALEEIHNLSPVPQPIGRFSFTFVNKSLCKLFVPKGSLEIYRAADVWNQFENIIEKDYLSNASVNDENISITPAKGGISVSCKQPEKLEIFNITGRKIYQAIIEKRKEILLEQGLYIVCVKNERRKILVK